MDRSVCIMSRRALRFCITTARAVLSRLQGRGDFACCAWTRGIQSRDEWKSGRIASPSGLPDAWCGYDHQGAVGHMLPITHPIAVAPQCARTAGAASLNTLRSGLGTGRFTDIRHDQSQDQPRRTGISSVGRSPHRHPRIIFSAPAGVQGADGLRPAGNG